MEGESETRDSMGIIVEESLSGHNAVIVPRFKRIVTGVFVINKWQVTDSFNNYNTSSVVVRNIRHVFKRSCFICTHIDTWIKV